jgi:hypothetical protein
MFHASEATAMRARNWMMAVALSALLPLRAGAAEIYLSTAVGATLGGLTFRNGDIARYDTSTDTATLFFSEDLFTFTEDVDAFELLSNDHLLLSTKSGASLGGLTFLDGDLVEYDPATDTAVLYFSESLFSSDTEVDAATVLPNGHLVLSTQGTETLGGLTFRDGDLAEYDPVSGFATLFFNENLFAASEDIDAFDVLPDGSIILSTTNAASLAGVAFTAGDLVQYFPSSNTASIFFSGSNFTAIANIDATAVFVPEPGTGLLFLLGLAGLAAYRRNGTLSARAARPASRES